MRVAQIAASIMTPNEKLVEAAHRYWTVWPEPRGAILARHRSEGEQDWQGSGIQPSWRRSSFCVICRMTDRARRGRQPRRERYRPRLIIRLPIERSLAQYGIGPQCTGRARPGGNLVDTAIGARVDPPVAD
jgi:hypothetical protein